MTTLTTLALLCSVAGVALANQYEFNCAPGKAGVVNLHMWKWSDVERECVTFLGPNNFCAVLLSPVNENQLMLQNFKQPWYQRWRPVSYKLDNRGGDENTLAEMLNVCNEEGVRVYIDLVPNHMTDAVTSGWGSGGSYYQGPSADFPGVPYSNTDFHKPRQEGDNPAIPACPNQDMEITDPTNKEHVRFCRKDGLHDLVTSSENVQDKLSTFANKLISMGAAGFRIDSAKYMEPSDIATLVRKFSTLSSWFPPGTYPFIYNDVADLTQSQTWAADYSTIGRTTEYRYGVELGDHFRGNNNKTLSGLKNFGSNMNIDNRTVVFVDNHLTQRGLEVGGFTSVVSYFDKKLYPMANAFMLAWPYGFPIIMSSYEWPRDIVGNIDRNQYLGPSANESGDILDVIVSDDELSCGNGWRCEHRMRTIFRMVDFRTRVENEPVVNWWDNNGNQIAFGRGNRGFIVFNNQGQDMNTRLQTGLAAGVYCDIISSAQVGPACSGKRITVDNKGVATFQIFGNETVPVIAINA